MTTARDIREYARNEGMTVGNRGRLAPEVKVAYFAAHPAEARALAAEKGVTIAAKGKISDESLSALSRTIA
jgi:hypothetical protein